MNPERLMAIGGMALVIAGLIYGAVYGAVFLPSLKTAPPALEKEALQAVDRLAIDEALEKWDRRTKLIAARELNRGSHSHLTLTGLTAIVFAPYLGRTDFGTSVRYLLAAGTLVGALALPVGVAAQIWSPRMGSVLAVAGGVLFLAALLAIALDYVLRGPRAKGGIAGQ